MNISFVFISDNKCFKGYKIPERRRGNHAQLAMADKGDIACCPKGCWSPATVSAMNLKVSLVQGSSFSGPRLHTALFSCHLNLGSYGKLSKLTLGLRWLFYQAHIVRFGSAKLGSITVRSSLASDCNATSVMQNESSQIIERPPWTQFTTFIFLTAHLALAYHALVRPFPTRAGESASQATDINQYGLVSGQSRSSFRKRVRVTTCLIGIGALIDLTAPLIPATTLLGDPIIGNLCVLYQIPVVGCRPETFFLHLTDSVIDIDGNFMFKLCLSVY